MDPVARELPKLHRIAEVANRVAISYIYAKSGQEPQFTDYGIALYPVGTYRNLGPDFSIKYEPTFPQDAINVRERHGVNVGDVEVFRKRKLIDRLPNQGAVFAGADMRPWRRCSSMGEAIVGLEIKGIAAIGCIDVKPEVEGTIGAVVANVIDLEYILGLQTFCLDSILGPEGILIPAE
ncbi:MAG: hypothetical protein HY362_01040 [Candidatus Aenigmarchaeota archaeon]|nr:hypothetical protein [Candidatus Aenigmarchaeota archaeon]